MCDLNKFFATPLKAEGRCSCIDKYGENVATFDDEFHRDKFVEAVNQDCKLERLRNAIQDAEELGLVRTEEGMVITGAIESDSGIVLVSE